MKKHWGLMTLGVVALFAMPIAGQATSIVSGGNTNATVSIVDGDGDIELTTAPSIDFGSVKATAGSTTITATSVNDPITVTNSGKTSGWNVTVNGDGFKDGSGEIDLGATLHLDNGTPTPVDSTNISTAPTAPAKLAVDGSGTDVNAFTAQTKAGVGDWTDVFSTSNVTLDIPAGATPNDYSTNLTWTLTNAPA
ncbi:WxL domain-containing protein [Lactiplantibacillus mudanjiangensis]|uniref:Cell surface protein [Lactobacillus sp.] n=1 Tax=Lactiplantibacillus mudanjiangensis TaxID=1296538 RepID=A0A660E8L9_9LACO|nr:WxL domain-containing protein [Lactiplantibacillus mudanjiangensis]VDG19533.1 cell surface protein [Lactobacillus sp.] [Lactiplantibacillus mudanjiangensis]VDG23364.1 cell surface protein [Lactobacillus sp.] [Lactiplantibacillus mudanjiangensis]VDG28753.1 cell surface protein [Lactobacillus sp.] [Lactiplantibacillus mudanjiangensis]